MILCTGKTKEHNNAINTECQKATLRSAFCRRLWLGVGLNKQKTGGAGKTDLRIGIWINFSTKV